MSASVIFIIFAIGFAALAGFRGRHPSPAVHALIANPAKRSATVGLFMLRGMSNFVDPAADATVSYSFRYGETPFTLRTLGWAVGLASAFVTAAIYLSWLWFDITTIGAWSFFKEDVSMAERALRTGMAVVPIMLMVASAAEVDTLKRNYFWCKEDVFGVGFICGWIAAYCINTLIWGNTGAYIVTAGLVLLVSHQRKIYLTILIAAYFALLFGLVGNFGATHAAISTFILVAAAMTFVAFVGTVEVLSALRWYDSNALMILVGLIAIILLALACALVIPILMAFILYALMELTPDSFNAGWVNTVGVFREGGLPAATMLALACIPPLLPALWFIGRGLGVVISRNTPMMPQFINDLHRSDGPLTRSEMSDLLWNYRRAHLLGYGVAGGISIVLLGLAVMLMRQVFEI